MSKTTYTATAPDGTEMTRTSARTYTHAVLVEVERRDGTTRWGHIAFSGREDLAVKEMNRWIKYRDEAHARADGGWTMNGTDENRHRRYTVVPVHTNA